MWIWCCQHILILLHDYFKQKKAICICFDWFQLGGRGSVRDSGIGEDMHQQRCQQPHRPGQRHLGHQMLVGWVVNTGNYYNINVSVHFKLKSSHISYSEKQACGVYNNGVWGWGGMKDIPVTQVSEMSNADLHRFIDILTELIIFYIHFEPYQVLNALKIEWTSTCINLSAVTCQGSCTFVNVARVEYFS